MRTQRFWRIRLTAVVMGTSSLWSGSFAAPPTLPVPCTPGACGATGASRFVTAGSATAVATQNALTVNQTSNSAILNWSSFNIGANGAVTFKQPNSSSIALNRIFQGSPSQIFGNLTANGQVYLVNLNGFVFGSTSTVNVGSLLASSLPLALTDSTFGNGILSPIQHNLPIFDATQDPLALGVGRTSVLDTNGQRVLDASGHPIPVQMVVQSGAKLTAADGGRLMLAGQDVTNGGSLTAPDGQVILAAGAKVFLQASSDPTLRGLVVEVDQSDQSGAGVNTAWNQLTGSLSTPRGNVTMVGLAVNQDGRISATTSVAANGSIRLEAARVGNVNTPLVSSQGGALTIGPHSEMDVLPELTSTATATSATTQYSSSVTLLGEQVILEGGDIVAPSGNLTAVAAANPSSGVIGVDPNARLRIDPGTHIDLSGSSTTLPMADNLVPVQLRATELADDPTQRNGALHGLTVYVDARHQPLPSLADVSGEVASVPQTIAQRTETGGNAVLESEGDAVFAKGASLNVSGGSTTYAGGVLQTSYLVGANGQLYPIATANPLLTYVGVVNPQFSQTYDKWGVTDVLPTPGLSSYQPGYVQGANAGNVQFAAPSMVLQGSLQGSAVSGLYQRTPATAALGGQLTIGVPAGLGPGLVPLQYLAPSVTLTPTPAPVVVADGTSLPSFMTLDLPLSYLTGSGFTSTKIYSDYGVTLPAGTPLVLPAGSTLAVNAARVDLLSGITDPGGSLSFQNVDNVGNEAATGARPGVYVGNGVTLDVRGLWTNDDFSVSTTPALSQTWQNGGSISLGTAPLSSAMLSIGNGVALRTSGGAWLQANGSLVAGTGGSVTMNAAALTGGVAIGNNVAIDGFGVNGAAGGTFNFAAPRIDIGAGTGWTTAQQMDELNAPGGVVQLHPGLFSAYGFQDFDISASGLVAPGAASANLFSVDPGTLINASVASLLLAPRLSLRPSAASLDGIGSVGTPAAYLRQSANISFAALPSVLATNTNKSGGTAAGDVDIGARAVISTDVGGSISVTSLGSIIDDGTLRAPSGHVTLQIISPAANDEAYLTFDVGFLPTQRIELGAAGNIDVSGTLVSQPSTLGLSLGALSGGGSVDLFADRGVVIADAGSHISVAGTTAALDVAQANGSYAHEIESTAGGSVAVHSGEAISLLGSIDAHAGAGGNSGTAAAGSLDLSLTRVAGSFWIPSPPALADTFSAYPLTVELLPSAPGLLSSATSNQAVLGAAQLTQWGIDSLRLEAGDAVLLSGNVSLALARQLVLSAPVIQTTGGTRANLSAPLMQVGYTEIAANTNVASGGTGKVSFSGNEIDLVGISVFQGTSDVRFTSKGDLQLHGEASGSGLASLLGGLSVDGNLALDAARIFPLTATSFTIDVGGAPGQGLPGTLTIGQTGANPGTPFSAGGSVTITADNITSTGTLYAPFGTISLDANRMLTLGDGSLTSVSGAGLVIPYGMTQSGGAQWLYDPGTGPATVTGIPDRALNLSAPAVTLTKGATVDLTGGGDLTAFEWVPGPGGSKDVLTANTAAAGYNPNLYAILPSMRGQSSPQDPEATSGSTILPGESVYLSGVAGLAAGFYPLLPARYALLPGAVLIEAESSFQSATPGVLGTLANGAPVVAGYLSFGSTGLHQAPGYTGFAVYPGSYGSELAAYDTHLASAYFSAVATSAGDPRPTLPADAGSLSISVTSAADTASMLDIAGVVRTAAGSGGLAAPISLSANDLVIGTATGPMAADAVYASGSVLEGWHPGSILLGGSLGAADGSTVDVLANTVTIGAGTALSADQIVVVAAQAIDVQNGASLQSTSASTGTALAALPAPLSVTLAGADGPNSAFLAVSDRNWLTPVRAAGAAPGAGSVAIDRGASVASRGSLSVDGLGGVTLNGTLTGVGAEWSLGSSSIAITSGTLPAGAPADALSIGPALLGQLGAAGAVRLASTGSIDLDTPTTLGGFDAHGAPILQSLILMGSSLDNRTGDAGAAGSTTSQFNAQTIVLQGVGTAPTTPSAGPGGSKLVFNAGELDIGMAPASGTTPADAAASGSNTLAVNGFAATAANVAGGVIGQGTGALNVGGDLMLAAAGVTVGAAANTTISASGALSVLPAAHSGGVLPSLLGGELTLSGSRVDVAGTISAPAGILTVAAAPGGNITVDAGATLSTAGKRVVVEGQTADAPGGSITLDAGGNLVLSAGSTLDVSGAGAAAAGSLALNATGSAIVGATLKGSSTGTGGSFSLDAGSLVAAAGPGVNPNPLGTLAKSLGGGGFTDSIDLRVRSGDLVLSKGASPSDLSGMLTANSVTLTADSGRVVIGGEISAESGALRGALSIFGGAGVDLTSTGSLHADGAGASGLGGSIEIGTGRLLADQNGLLDRYDPNATINLEAGSTISARGAAGEGTLLLRAPAVISSGDIAVQALASNTSGVGHIVIEPLLPFNTADQSGNTVVFSNATTPSAGDWQNVQQYVDTFMASAASNISSRLASGTTPLGVEAGVEIIAPGALVLQASAGPGSSALDLSNWRPGNAPVDLTIRAGGDISVNGTVTDGFATTQIGTASQPTLLAGPSSSIRLVAGADFSSADPLAVVAGGSGDLTFGAGAVVRTGTGDISLAAAHDIVLAGAGSGAYTAGVPTIAPGGSAADPYAAVPAAAGATAFDDNGNPVGMAIPNSNLLMSFPSGGGNLVVRAGGDIENLSTTAAGSVSNWQLREGGATYQPNGSDSEVVPAAWGVNLATYNWNFGTLGGGDLRLAAGKNINNVSAAAAGSLLPQQGGATQYVTSGGLDFRAGGDIGSAQIFLADGRGTVTAGGAMTAILPPSSGSTTLVGSALYLQSGSIDVSARLGLAIDGMYNPTGLAQTATGARTLPAVLGKSFLSYGDSSAINLTSTAGDIDLGDSASSGATLLGAATSSASGPLSGYAGDVVAPTLSVDALGGSILFGQGLGGSGRITLAPSPQGQLNLLAAQNITGFGNISDYVTMSDALPGSYASVSNPTRGQVSVEDAAFSGDLHAADPNLALITAGNDIRELALSVPKAARLVAGRDIFDVVYVGQNQNPSDETLISAGRDLSYATGYGGAAISVGGPGRLDVLTGRNLSLGFTQGLVTTGNLLNANLNTSQGADVTLATGLATNPDYAGFLTDIIAPSPTYQAQLVSYVESLQGSTGLSFAKAEAAFQHLSADQQRPLIDDVFFNELLLSGRAAIASTTPLTATARGYAAIDALFPGSRTGSAGAVPGAYAGDLTLDFSRIYTLSGGNITLVVPGGGIDVGLASPPPALTGRPASTLGIVAQGAGNIDIYTKSDIDVNSSRIFTLGGGNIEIWSDEGSIDAGRGAKTAISAPPPVVLINTDGTVTLDYSGAAAGSGIRTIQTNPDFPLGNVDLFAPVGTVNAGDAGIGAAGNIHVLGTVIGLDNITFGGTSAGVPSQVSNISASLSGASSAANAATNASTNAVASNAADKESQAPLAQTALSWLDVFVTGLGEENCKPDDIDCLKRQKTTTR